MIKITSKDIDINTEWFNTLAIQLNNTLTNLMSEDYYALTTVADELTRFEICKPNVVTDEDIEALKSVDQLAFMISFIIKDANDIEFYVAVSGPSLISLLANEIEEMSSELADDINDIHESYNQDSDN